jgi:ribonuclease VapC
VLFNLGEIYYITYREIDKKGSDNCLATINKLPIRIVVPDLELILRAATIKAKYPISYADAFVVSLSIEQNATIVTGDPEFKKVRNITSIKWLEKEKLFV